MVFPLYKGSTVGELRSVLCTEIPLYVRKGSYMKQMPLESIYRTSSKCHWRAFIVHQANATGEHFIVHQANATGEHLSYIKQMPLEKLSYITADRSPPVVGRATPRERPRLCLWCDSLFGAPAHRTSRATGNGSGPAQCLAIV